jgi:hypothetical protein
MTHAALTLPLPARAADVVRRFALRRARHWDAEYTAAEYMAHGAHRHGFDDQARVVRRGADRAMLRYRFWVNIATILAPR